MAPKKGQKMSLNAFLGDNALGSWADEMDSLPSAPAPRTDEERARDFGRNDFSSRPDRAPLGPPRDDVPLPTQPPYTAFVGNLAFDMSDMELGEFFSPHKTVSVKIITDREGKPKGFGYVEFEELDGLKDALAKSGSSLSHRTIRVNVAEPPKERERGFGSGGGFDDDAKFDGNWRRDGPLPASEPQRGGGASRGAGFGFRDGAGAGDDEGPRRGARFAPSGDAEQSRERPEMNSDWRGSRAPMPPPEREREGRRGFGGPPESAGAADTEETWSKGAKFRPSPAGSDTGSMGRKFGTGFTERSGSAGAGAGAGPGSGAVTPGDDGDWRTRARPAMGSQRQSSYERSPTNSTPPTPQLARRKLELLPRSGTGSTVTTPLSSPSPSSTFSSAAKSNPFGTAKPVDVSAREKEVEERLAKEREEAPSASAFARHPISRETSRQASTRTDNAHPLSRETSRQASTRPVPRKSSSPPASATVRPAFSFANAAKKAAEDKAKDAQKEGEPSSSQDGKDSNSGSALEQVEEKVAQIAV